MISTVGLLRVVSVISDLRRVRSTRLLQPAFDIQDATSSTHVLHHSMEIQEFPSRRREDVRTGSYSTVLTNKCITLKGSSLA